MTAQQPVRLAADVLVIGAGGAGMYAALEAARGPTRLPLALQHQTPGSEVASARQPGQAGADDDGG